jgi:hypothetical protein
VRELWRQTDLGEFTGSFTASFPRHGVRLVRIWRPNDGAKIASND